MSIFNRFGEYYDLVYKGVVNYEKDCDALEKVFAKFCKMKPKSILDLGCGTGNHALMLAKRGYSVSGIDLSKTMIQKAKLKMKTAGLDVDFHVQAMQRLRLDSKFDCAISMFGALGYVCTYNGLVKVFSGLRRHLKRDGLFIFEFWNVGGVRPSPYQMWIMANDGNLAVYRLSETRFDHQTNLISLYMKFIVLSGNRLVETFEENHKLRCYTLTEMRQYLQSNGFELLSAYDSTSEYKEKLKDTKRKTFRVLAVAKRT